MADALNVPQPSRPAGRRFGGLTIPTGEEQLAGGWIHTTAAPPQTWHHLFARARIAFLWNTLLNAYDTCGGRLANGRRLLAIQAEQGDAAAAKAAGKFGMPPPERVAQLERTNSLLFRALRYMAMAFGRYAEHEVDSLFEHAGAMTAPDQADSQVRMLWSPWNIIEGPTDRSDATGGTLDDFTGTIDCLLRDTSHSMGAAAAHRGVGAAPPVLGADGFSPDTTFHRGFGLVNAARGPAVMGIGTPDALSVIALMMLRRRLRLLLQLEVLTNQLASAATLLNGDGGTTGYLQALGTLLQTLTDCQSQPVVLYCPQFWARVGSTYHKRT